MSTGRWKALLIALTLFSAMVMLIEGVAATAAFNRGPTGRHGIQGDPKWLEGHQALVVRDGRALRSDEVAALRWAAMQRERVS